MSRLPVAILAGGLATRLGSLSCNTPKSLLEVAGEPFVYHQLRHLPHPGGESGHPVSGTSRRTGS